MGEKKVELGLPSYCVLVPRRGATMVAVGETYGIRSVGILATLKGVEQPVHRAMCSPFRAVFLSSSDPDP